MSLNTIELKDFLVSELYHGNLLDSPGFRRHPVSGSSATETAGTEPGAPSIPDLSSATAAAPTLTTASGTSSLASGTSSPASKPQAPLSGETSPTPKPQGAAPASPASIPQAPASAPASQASSPAQAAPPVPTEHSPATPARPISAPAPLQTAPATQPPASATQTPTAAAAYKFLGNNRRNISIIVHSPGIAFLPDDQLNFLGKMLTACNMNMGDVAIVNHAAAPVSIDTLRLQLQPSFMLLFGAGPVDIGLPMDFPVFKIQSYDRCVYLSAPPLGDMLLPGEEARLLKSKLWISLKTMFEI